MSRNYDKDAQKNTYVCSEVINIRHIMRVVSWKEYSLKKEDGKQRKTSNCMYNKEQDMVNSKNKRICMSVPR